jgi:hypothetical protein
MKDKPFRTRSRASSAGRRSSCAGLARYGRHRRRRHARGAGTGGRPRCAGQVHGQHQPPERVRATLKALESLRSREEIEADRKDVRRPEEVCMNLHSMKNVPGAVRAQEARGLRRILRPRQDLRPRRQGSVRPFRPQAQAGFEGGQMPLIRKLPKRGFNHASKVDLCHHQRQPAGPFDAGTEVTPETCCAGRRAQRGRRSGSRFWAMAT